jgi:hypothetical protein
MLFLLGNASGFSPSGEISRTLYTCLIIKSASRPYVKSLTKDLRDATFQGFDSFEVAAENYNKARSIGVIGIKRIPGDDLKFGPVSEGMQDPISL